MAFLRADTPKTMKSRTWSTEELSDGLLQIMHDGDLPEDLARLKEPSHGMIRHNTYHPFRVAV